MQLQRVLRVSVFEAEGTLMMGRYRPEILALLSLVQDYHGMIKPADVARELFGGLPEHYAQRALERCEQMHLLERSGSKEQPRYRLNEGGIRSLEHERVFTPEYGRWRLYTVEDPLLAQSLLHVESLEPRGEGEQAELEPLTLKPGSGDSLLDAKQSFFIERPSSQCPPLKGLKCGDFQLQLTLEWKTPPKGREQVPELTLKGSWGLSAAERRELSGKTLAAVPALKQQGFKDFWAEVISKSAGLPKELLQSYQQTGTITVLPRAFRELSDEIRRSLKASLKLASVKSEQWGTFDHVEAAACTLIPLHLYDALAWGQWLLEDRVKNYLSLGELKRHQAAITKHLGVKVPWPSTEALVADLVERRKQGEESAFSRYLLTSYDLGLWSLEEPADESA